MTPSEIRSLYVETLARAAYENRLRPWSVDPAWADLSEQRRQMYVHMGMQATDALAAAGLLPTCAERADFDSNAELTVWINGERVTKQMQRYVGPWREVPE